MPVIAGQCFITFKKCVVLGQKGEAGIAILSEFCQGTFPKIIMQV